MFNKLLILFFFMFSSSNAFAYLDPGTGSLIIQSVIAGIAAAAYGIRMYWYKIKGWIFRQGNDNSIDIEDHKE